MCSYFHVASVFLYIVDIFGCGCVAKENAIFRVMVQLALCASWLCKYNIDSNIRRLVISGYVPVSASNGFLLMCVWGSLFLIYIAWIRVYDQYSGFINALWSNHRIIFTRYLFELSAIVFWADASTPVISKIIFFIYHHLEENWSAQFTSLLCAYCTMGVFAFELIKNTLC